MPTPLRPHVHRAGRESQAPHRLPATRGKRDDRPARQRVDAPDNPRAADRTACGIHVREFRRREVEPDGPAAASMQVAANPRDTGQTNPLVSSTGGVGLGKTHLMHAIGKPDGQGESGTPTSIYLQSETVRRRRWSTALQTQQNQRVQENSTAQLMHYSSDDIQFLRGKKSAPKRNSFTHSNRLLERERLVVLDPAIDIRRKIHGLENRPQGHDLAVGLPIAIEPPELETPRGYPDETRRPRDGHRCFLMTWRTSLHKRMQSKRA